MGEPPFDGSAQLTETDPLLLATAAARVGALGTLGTWIQLEAVDGLLAPLELVAVTVKV